MSALAKHMAEEAEALGAADCPYDIRLRAIQFADCPSDPRDAVTPTREVREVAYATTNWMGSANATAATSVTGASPPAAISRDPGLRV